MSQEPEQKRAGQRGEGQPESAGAGPEGAAERPAAPERPKYTPPSYVPPVDLDKDANATEPIPNYPTRPLPRDLPPGAPPLPGTAEHASETTAGQSQQTRAQQTEPQQAQAQTAGGQPGHAAASGGQPGQTQAGQTLPGQTQPRGYPAYHASPPGAGPAQHPGQPAQYPGQPAQYPGAAQQYPGQPAQYPGQQAQYPGQQAQYPGAAQQYAGQPYPPQGYPPQPYAQGYPGYPSAQAYGQPLYYAPAAEPKGLSIASMICGIAIYAGFGFFILPQIAAVVLGHMGLAREPAGRGFAIAGLVMGYVGIALTLAVLAFFVVFASSFSQYPY